MRDESGAQSAARMVGAYSIEKSWPAPVVGPGFLPGNGGTLPEFCEVLRNMRPGESVTVKKFSPSHRAAITAAQVFMRATFMTRIDSNRGEPEVRRVWRVS